MRYIANSAGYLQEVSFGATIYCNGRGCTEYTGGVPDGYASLADWFTKECETLYRWHIVKGELTLDPDAKEPAVYVEPEPVLYTAVKLWKNPTPTASYVAQTIEVPGLAQCDYVWINFNALNISTCFGVDMYVFKDRDGLANYASHTRYDGGVYVSGRTVTVNFGTETVVFGAGNQNGSTSAARMIPQFIVGFTGVADKPTADDDETRAICGAFLCGEAVAGQ